MISKKPFDSFRPYRFTNNITKIRFWNYFTDGSKIFFNDQESCVRSGDVTTQYSKLEKGAWQGDSVSAYLFVLCQEILFTIVKNNKDFKSLKFLEIPSCIQLTQLTRLFSLKIWIQ